ncbi:type II toxin-antitoxin system RelE/ParE family toxin [bacterium]|nr:type II toxin-antitoxin system RelE/ParE family toxin [bacterium]
MEEDSQDTKKSSAPRIKAVIWCSNNLRKEIRNWPTSVRMNVGYQLSKVQNGGTPDNFRAMTSIGPGVIEIKDQDADKAQYRLLYIASFPEAVYVLHLISKKSTQKTSQRDLKQAQNRLRTLKSVRKEKGLDKCDERTNN